MTRAAPAAPEFSRPVAARELGDQALLKEIEATPAEREALARRLGLLSLDRLAASLRLRRLKGGLIEVAGRFAAELAQSCVVTLEPVPSSPSGEFSVLFDSGMPATGAGPVDIDPEVEDPPEPLTAGRIDLGELVVQQLAVSLDPYPRRPGARLPEAPPAVGAEPGAESPFAALKRLKNRS